MIFLLLFLWRNTVFNRYMVECESMIAVHIFDCFLRFNRYMVECEFADVTAMKQAVEVLIDTWWNVNA